MDAARHLGLMEVVLCTTWFAAAIMYVRAGQEMEDR
jgi:uncharacterized membrane protein